MTPGQGRFLCIGLVLLPSFYRPPDLPAQVRPPLVFPPGELAGVVSHGPRTVKEIALTFDACSTPWRGKFDAGVANVLRETRTPATLFLGGKWAGDVASDVRALASDSLFEFGNHAYRHPHLTRVPDDRVRKELEDTQRIVTRITGKRPVLFRAPYGELDAGVVAAAGRLGLTTIEYDLASGDPDSLISREALVRYVTSTARRGSIIVMHINGRGWHTAEALPEIISRLRAKGYVFVTVSRLLRTEGDVPGPPRD
jgi:peptidoglycan/xylan/chitin deacetylase (PgdA/CDA1 family)